MITDPSRLLAEGVRLFNAGHYWEAHEAWEAAWTPDRRGPERGFYKGLIQIAAGSLHFFVRRNRRGARLKWGSGADLLRPYLPVHQGLDLSALVSWADASRAALDGEAWPQLMPPRIQPSA